MEFKEKRTHYFSKEHLAAFKQIKKNKGLSRNSIINNLIIEYFKKEGITFREVL